MYNDTVFVALHRRESSVCLGPGIQNAMSLDDKKNILIANSLCVNVLCIQDHTRCLFCVNYRLTLRFFGWLVGPMKVVEVEVNSDDTGKDAKVKQWSGVRIHQCRYLAESNCVSMCVNLCKAPCQTFFTEQLGMPLYMEPNFEDRSCLMVFGQYPPPLDQDPATQQSCLTGCATSMPGNTCHKLAE
jgi:hypothetical protein